MDPVNLAAKLATFGDHWQPRTVSRFNDDFFLVLAGHLTIELRDRSVRLGPGELFVVPRGVEHRPVATEEVHLLLIEPSGTPNTGDTATAAPLAARVAPTAVTPGLRHADGRVVRPIDFGSLPFTAGGPGPRCWWGRVEPAALPAGRGPR